MISCATGGSVEFKYIRGKYSSRTIAQCTSEAWRYGLHASHGPTWPGPRCAAPGIALLQGRRAGLTNGPCAGLQLAGCRLGNAVRTAHFAPWAPWQWLQRNIYNFPTSKAWVM